MTHKIPVKPFRSVLYMPGSNPRALDKGRDLDCDAIIMDLEDAVAPSAKQQARINIAKTIEKGGYGYRNLAVRINGLDTPWGTEDLDMAAASKADVVVLAKVESAELIQQVAEKIPASQTIWAMIETPAGVLNAQQIAASDEKLGGLIMGTSDLAKELRCLHTADRVPFLTSFGLCILAARANGLLILDGVHLDLDDDAGFAAACQQGLDLGFDGKTLIHPKTIASANAIYAPDEEQVKEARAIIDAQQAAEKEGSGVVVLNGKLIENLHVEMANHLLELDRAIRNR